MPNESTTKELAVSTGNASMEIAVRISSIQELEEMATKVSKSSVCPVRFKEKSGDVFVAILHGREIGLGPFQALSSIAVINGTPSIFGDAALALVRASGKLEDFHEEIVGEGENTKAICYSKRAGMTRERVTEFSVKDAKVAGLWGKPGPWTQYWKRMLMFRARGFNLRDNFGDVLKGLAIYEEAQDIPMEERGEGVYGPAPSESEEAKPSLASKLKKPQAANVLVEEVQLPASEGTATPATAPAPPKPEPAKPKATAKPKAEPKAAKQEAQAPKATPAQAAQAAQAPPPQAEAPKAEPIYEKAGIELAKIRKIGNAVTGVLSLISAASGKKKEVSMMPHESPETTLEELEGLIGQSIRFQYRIQQDANNKPQVWVFDVIPESRFDAVMAKRAVQEGEAPPEEVVIDEGPDDFLAINPNEAYHKG